MTETVEFQRFLMATLLREYRLRKSGPLGKASWGNLLLWARKAQLRARVLERTVNPQGELFA